MKITLEDINSEDIEIIIRGDISSSQVNHIVNLLKSTSITTKIMLLDEDREILSDIAQIMYFETNNRKVVAQTTSGSYYCGYTLSQLLDMFKSHNIAQIGKGLLVNISYVKSLEAEFSGNYTLTLKNGEKLLISRFYMKDFRKAIMDS